MQFIVTLGTQAICLEPGDPSYTQSKLMFINVRNNAFSGVQLSYLQSSKYTRNFIANSLKKKLC